MTEITTTLSNPVTVAGESGIMTTALDENHGVFLVDENGDYVELTEEEFYEMLEKFFAEDDAEGQEIYLQLLGLTEDDVANDNDETTDEVAVAA